MRRGPALAVLLLTAFAAIDPALAGKADVVSVKMTREAAGTYAFDVTISSDDTGWDKYADRWEIVAPDGRVLGTRVLLHPHETEQPFMRSLSGVEIPDGMTSVTVRAHDKVEGFGGIEMRVDIPR